MDNDIQNFGRKSLVTWTQADLKEEQRLMELLPDEEPEESLFSDNPNPYFRYIEEVRSGLRG